eukprot:TRINITY_DN12832_c0_g1_i1.p1 TRINITY_DN12832_c0_g1~~TRINITY_DN12832_c0_g1_i1.p1  ORF type:complete len:437 (+),score=103.51 TRINITY_DN12832_c0_g1_i1:113-1423(+)
MTDYARFQDAEEDEFVVTRASILSRSFNWEAFHRASLISADDLKLLQQYDNGDDAAKQALLKQRGADYASLLLRLVSEINKDETLQYVLSLVDEIVERRENLKLFLAVKDAYLPFRRHLDSGKDPYVAQQASSILALILAKMEAPPTDVVDSLFSRILDSLRRDDRRARASGLASLQVMLRCDGFRAQFCSRDGLGVLSGLLKSSGQSLQLVYQVVYCLWLISYNTTLGESFTNTTLVSKIVFVAKTSSKEKVIRVALATLKNLHGQGMNTESMIESKLNKVLETLANRKWGDQDIVDDIEFLNTALVDKISHLSSFDVYKQELLSSTSLEWSPVHRSEKFWRENVMRFEENDFRALRVLAELLETSPNAITLAVASFDVGEFVRFHPRGRQIINKIGIKISVMKLMTHDDPDVRKHSLLCIQKLMVQDWEFLAAR